MENPVKYLAVKNNQAARTLGETGGLGTVATRADIIEKLFYTFMMEKKGNEIHLTSKAKQLLELVPEDLKKPDLTADWEQKLSDISKGKLRQDAFLKDIRKYTCDIVDEIKAGQGTFRHDNMTNKICPNCGKHLLAVNGKNSRMLGVPGQRVRIPGNHSPHYQRPLSEMPQENGASGKRERRDLRMRPCGYKERAFRFPGKTGKKKARALRSVMCRNT